MLSPKKRKPKGVPLKLRVSPKKGAKPITVEIFEESSVVEIHNKAKSMIESLKIISDANYFTEQIILAKNQEQEK